MTRALRARNSSEKKWWLAAFWLTETALRRYCVVNTAIATTPNKTDLTKWYHANAEVEAELKKCDSNTRR